MCLVLDENRAGHCGPPSRVVWRGGAHSLAGHRRPIYCYGTGGAPPAAPRGPRGVLPVCDRRRPAGHAPAPNSNPFLGILDRCHPGPAPRYLDAHSDLVSQYFCLCPNLARGSRRDSPPLASIILALIILFRPCGGVPPYCQTQAALFAKAPGAALPPLIPREKDGR